MCCHGYMDCVLNMAGPCGAGAPRMSEDDMISLAATGTWLPDPSAQHIEDGYVHTPSLPSFELFNVRSSFDHLLLHLRVRAE